MFGSEILEIGIGLVFVFLCISLIATTLREIIESLLKTRAVQLERGLRLLLDDKDGSGITKAVFEHPLIYALFQGDYDPNKLKELWRDKLRTFVGMQPAPGERTRVPLFTNLPAYVPSRNFAMALMHVVANNGSGPGAAIPTVEAIKGSAITLPDGRLKQALLAAIAEGGDDLIRIRAGLEGWFDGTMDRVSGWYKRETQWILLVLGLLIAGFLNVDAVDVVRELSANNTLRSQLMVNIGDMTKNAPGQIGPVGPQDNAPGQSKPVRAQNNAPGNITADQIHTSLSNMVGWQRIHAAVQRDLVTSPNASVFWLRVKHTLAAIPGWLITAIAVSLGAPFWFDLLNKLMIIRSTVKPYEKSLPVGSEDRQGHASAAAQPGAGTADVGASSPAEATSAGTSSTPAAAMGNGVGNTVHVRLAISTADITPDSLSLAVDGKDWTSNPVSVTDSEQFFDVPLQVGAAHVLSAKATRDGRPVSWAERLVADIDDDGLPMAPQWQQAA